MPDGTLTFYNPGFSLRATNGNICGSVMAKGAR